MTIEFMCTADRSRAPEECVARSIAAHHGNNSNVAGGAHLRLGKLAGLLRYLIRKEYTLYWHSGIIFACEQDPRKQLGLQKHIFCSARKQMKREPLFKLVMAGSTNHFDNFFGRRLR